MKTTTGPTASAVEQADSDSVNLGSNPSSPATQNTDVSAESGRGHFGHPGQTAHSGRTEVGTPGPWRYQEGADAYTHIVRALENRFICQLAQDTSGRAEADARLIAAAPDLLAALRLVRSLIVEAAETGFNPLSGDWAERLYRSQSVSFDAVRKAGAKP